MLFHEQMQRELQKVSRGEQFALLYIDIDEFKSVNDSLGHLVGDELLKAVAASLRRYAQKSDFVARLGGDEFAIVQTGVREAATSSNSPTASLTPSARPTIVWAISSPPMPRSASRWRRRTAPTSTS